MNFFGSNDWLPRGLRNWMDMKANPLLMAGDLKTTKTRMAFRREGDVTTYEWAIQVFDKYPRPAHQATRADRV